MYTPTADVVADAFDLGRPVGDLVLVRRGDTDTWRLETTSGSYFLKGYWPSTTYEQLEIAMAFERRALESGIDMPGPIQPPDPLMGWVTHINGRLFRVYEWISHRAVSAGADIADWLGRTMARIHQLEPLDRPGLPDWWRAPIWPRTTWEGWFDEARWRDKSWSALAPEYLPYILDVSARIEALFDTAPDLVTTHGDFKTHNMIMAPTGPVLVDWDSVRTDSAALEAGRVAYIFGAGERSAMRRILRVYTAAGGDIGWVGDDLFLSVARHDLQALFERIRVSLGETPAARWMGGAETIEQDIGVLLRQLPEHLALTR